MSAESPEQQIQRHVEQARKLLQRNRLSRFAILAAGCAAIGAITGSCFWLFGRGRLQRVRPRSHSIRHFNYTIT